MTELRLRIIPSTSLHSPSLSPQQFNMTPRTITFDWTAVANHGSVLGCAGYALTNFIRAFFISITLEDNLLENILMFILASIIAIDAGIYWKAIYSDRADRLRDRSSARSHPKDIEAIPLSSPNGHDTLEVDNPPPSSAITRIHRILCCTHYHIHHPNHPHPLSAESIAEILNVIGSVGYVISALVPLCSSVARNAEQLRLLTKWGNIIDTCAMLAFLFGGFVYAITWQRDDEDRQKWTIRWKWEGAPAWLNKWVGFKDWNWWAMTANLLAGFGYLGSTLYGLIIDAQLATDSNATPEDQLHHVYMYLARQRQAAFVGDLLYLLSSIAMEIAYYQDRDVLMKLATSSSSSTTTSSTTWEHDAVDNDPRPHGRSQSGHTLHTRDHDADVERLLGTIPTFASSSPTPTRTLSVTTLVSPAAQYTQIQSRSPRSPDNGST